MKLLIFIVIASITVAIIMLLLAYLCKWTKNEKLIRLVYGKKGQDYNILWWEK